MLIDPSFRNYMFHTLRSCHQYRENIYYYILNFGILFVFVIIAGLALYNCSLNKNIIAPEGSSRNNHRQDQSVLTMLM